MSGGLHIMGDQLGGCTCLGGSERLHVVGGAGVFWGVCMYLEICVPLRVGMCWRHDVYVCWGICVWGLWVFVELCGFGGYVCIADCTFWGILYAEST